MSPEIGLGRDGRYSYGFDEVALVPSKKTVDPADVDTSFKIGDFSFEVPIIAAAMDSSVDIPSAALFTKLGGLAVLNLQGVACRYDDPEEALDKIRKASPEDADPGNSGNIQHHFDPNWPPKELPNSRLPVRSCGECHPNVWLDYWSRSCRCRSGYPRYPVHRGFERTSVIQGKTASDKSSSVAMSKYHDCR